MTDAFGRVSDDLRAVGCHGVSRLRVIECGGTGRRGDTEDICPLKDFLFVVRVIERSITIDTGMRFGTERASSNNETYAVPCQSIILGRGPVYPGYAARTMLPYGRIHVSSKVFNHISSFGQYLPILPQCWRRHHQHMRCSRSLIQRNSQKQHQSKRRLPGTSWGTIQT